MSSKFVGCSTVTQPPASLAAARASRATAAPLSSVMKSHFSDGYLEIGSVLASVFGSVGRTIQER
jgi:hypothetical protein